MTLLIVSFLAGVLTVLAPCILPLLPVIIGSSATGRSQFTPYVVVVSLALSIILFTFLLKVSTAFIMVPPQFWTYLSGGILMLFGLVLLFPALWEKMPGVSKLSVKSNKVVGAGYQKHSIVGDILIGAALGPVFSTCSPTYFVILATVLPASFLLGTLYLLAYVLGLSLILLAISLLGQRFANKLAVIADSRSRFKRWLGIAFLIIGLFIIGGFDKKIQTAVLEGGFFDVTKIEELLLKRVDSEILPSASESAGIGMSYQEIVGPTGYVNSEGITIGEQVGKKVILIDFMTYSCINCQRTFPYLNAWYEKYKDEGLIVIGIHTPEFAFEKNIVNVEEALMEAGIKFPVVLDNEYATWRAYGNRYWPRKYLIDINGVVVYDHIGEGSYEETEMKIRELLVERAQRLGERGVIGSDLAAAGVEEVSLGKRSPETYFGSSRNEFLGNGVVKQAGLQVFKAPDEKELSKLYLDGNWNITKEYAEATTEAKIFYRYNGKSVYLVLESQESAEIEVWQDGVFVKNITVTASTLYTLIQNSETEEHTLELRLPVGVRAYAFTFG